MAILEFYKNVCTMFFEARHWPHLQQTLYFDTYLRKTQTQGDNNSKLKVKTQQIGTHFKKIL